MLTVAVPSPTATLVTTDDLRTVLRTTSTEDDALHLAMVKRSTAWAEKYVGYPLRMQGYIETVPGYGSYNLLLARRPIRQVRRVFPSTATSADDEILSSEYRVDAPTGRISRYEGFAWTVARGRSPAGGFALDPVESPPIPYGEVDTYLVEYSAGFVGDEGTTSTWDGSTSTGPTVPEDIKAGILAKAAEYVVYGALGGPDITSKSVGDLSISYGSTRPSAGGAAGLGLPEALLAPYRSF